MKVIDEALNQSEQSVCRNVNLSQFTTMRVGGVAQYFSRVRSEEQLVSLFRWSQDRSLPFVVLGHGSNMVISDLGVPGLVIKMEILGIRCVEEDDNIVTIEVGAGECWDEFVDYTVQNGWWGIENLSLIPGTVGAVAIQNVSAYGQESRNVIKCVRAYDTSHNSFTVLGCDDCHFGFRKSIFNTSALGRFVIVSIVFSLMKQGGPSLSRPEVERTLQTRRGCESRNSARSFRRLRRLAPVKKRVPEYSQREIRDAIIHLRTSGGPLPLPNTVGNAGTFFKACIVPHAQFRWVMLRCLIQLPLRAAIKILACRWLLSSGEGVKIPARILIEGCRLHGISKNKISLLRSNCAVLINAGHNSSSQDIMEIIRTLRRDIYQRTGVKLSVEPSLIGFLRDELDRTFDVL